MTGTASELNEINDDIFAKPPHTEHVAINGAYSISDRISGCLLADLSRTGADILIPHHTLPASQNISISILSPDNSEEVLAVLRSEQSWLDKNHTEDHHKIGVKFIDTGLSDIYAIDALMQLFMRQIACLKCVIHAD